MWRVWVRRGECIGSWWGNRRERDHWGDLGVDGWIILEVGCEYMDWIGLAQDRDRWLVSTVMNLWVPLNAGNFLTSCKPVSCSRRTLHHAVSKNDVVGTVARVQAGRFRVQYLAGAIYFFLLQNFHTCLGVHASFYLVHTKAFVSQGSSSGGLTLTSSLRMVVRWSECSYTYTPNLSYGM